MSAAEEFEQHRDLLFAIAYRMLGSVGDAEDVVQETWLRLAAADARPVSMKAYLSTIVTRLSVDHLRSARVRRESYVGTWFPEPLLNDRYEGPEESAELADSVSMAALILLERLTPLERAVFVLREVFGYSFAEIAAAVGRTEDACRQLGVRARRHMDEGRPRFDADQRDRERLAARFFDALYRGDVERLREILTADAALIADSGGKAPLWGAGIFGRENVSQLLATRFRALLDIGISVEPHTVNGQPGAVFRDRAHHVLHTWAMDIVDGQVQTIRTVLNPDKLRHVGPVANAWAVLREANHAAKRQRPLN
ncbi:RNA polymerase sigma-70 factor [Kribbella sp. NPDC051586]|uniref:RNA polymerase sigma-70 factor n=1 Tax=Kribbella sp. NPDC051586 TaxID=3364118 RepID=UPI00379E5245